MITNKWWKKKKSQRVECQYMSSRRGHVPKKIKVQAQCLLKKQFLHLSSLLCVVFLISFGTFPAKIICSKLTREALEKGVKYVES